MMLCAIRCLCLIFLLPAFATFAFAQTQHVRPIKVIVPFPAGETADLIVRFLADDMAKELGQPVIVDNRPGASGLIGLQAAANAEPDGHTLAMGQLGNMAITPMMNNWQFDVREKFEPVALTYTNYIIILATPSLPVKTLPELIAYSKANRGAVRIGTVGLGSFPHLMFEMLRKQAGLDYTHVTYRGGSQIVPDLMEARIEVSTLGSSTGAAYINDGRLRAIAMSGRVRNEATPDVPTVSETVPGLTMVGWFGFFAPKGTPAPMINRINAAVNRAMSNPKAQERAKSLHIEPAPGGPADFARVWSDDYARLSTLIGELGIAAK
jgi:tripartite-type tricarboxylate transporter receptor subunit TctC